MCLWFCDKCAGDKFFYSQGPKFRIVVTDPNLVKEILTNKLYYKEPISIIFKLAFFGEGLFTINGKDWTERRQIMEHVFHHEALKGMVNIMVKATALVLDTWEQKVQDGGGSTQLEINNDMSTITSHIISHTTFGNNYKEGQQMFEQMEALLCNLVEAIKNPLFFLPGFRFIPIPRNREISKLIHKNEKILKQVIQIRQEQARVNKSSCVKDILDFMMSTHFNNYKRKVLDATTCQLNIQNLVDECKTLFLAGYASTASHLTWTMLLLAEYPEWQERARIEVWEVCGFNNEMDVTKLNQMKIVGMILNEVH
ncbi:hypothetical protein CY35_11G002100 [Sphagnum magellanicum]|nr:hypothetical protein CY35_11G002100 [Sphagnum magellanicum]